MWHLSGIMIFILQNEFCNLVFLHIRILDEIKSKMGFGAGGCHYQRGQRLSVLFRTLALQCLFYQDRWFEGIVPHVCAADERNQGHFTGKTSRPETGRRKSGISY